MSNIRRLVPSAGNRTGGSAYSVLELAMQKTRFVAEYEDVHERDTFRHLDLHVHAIPHGALTNDDPVIPMIDTGKRNILVTHGMVPGILDPGISAELISAIEKTLP